MKPLCIAHRGCTAADRPENSLAAVEAALAFGVDGIEVDLWFLHNRFWITHDRFIDTMSGNKQLITSLSRTELEAQTLSNGEPLADLPELLRLVQGRCLLNLELKNSGGSTLLAKALDDFRQESAAELDHIVISSFNHHELFACRQQLPNIKLGVLLEGLPLNYAACAEPLKPYSFNSAVSWLSRALTDDVHARGFKHWVYTANVPADWQCILDYDIDACFTDRAAEFTAYCQDPAAGTSH
ncbi:glycerophosphodiester phosphodiesterase [Gilvimarinus algae]|uniref:Glycerophosphodiester phosphodiesterase n=1 Tax=Gilvimarinus algae TaxID=3058037 RepID=A0ABT8TIY3_9GAMM|nr:glycerophosphodiester phosphodiesterase [Gilvimarinus sp. SDUM040014]MDO3383545.1 glycerophosphodiester phosphodiesterase [Gilvimarinus sp. SDUM040014]